MRASELARRQKRRDALEAYKREKGCIDCGTREGRMDFDHRDKATKLFKVGANVGYGWDTLLREVAKCDVRCAPCHTRRHHIEEPGHRSRRGIPNGQQRHLVSAAGSSKASVGGEVGVSVQVASSRHIRGKA